MAALYNYTGENGSAAGAAFTPYYEHDTALMERIRAIETTTTSIWKFGGAILVFGGTIGNLITIAVLIFTKLRSHAISTFLIALSVADLCVLYSGAMRYWILSITDYDDVRENSSISCRIHIFATYSSLQFCSWILLSVTCERFVSVFSPFNSKRHCTAKKCRILLVSIASVLALVNSHWFFTSGGSQYELSEFEIPINNSYISNEDYLPQSTNFSSPFQQSDTVKSIATNETFVYIQINATHRQLFQLVQSRKLISVCDYTTEFHRNFAKTFWPWIDLCLFSIFPGLMILMLNVAISGRIFHAHLLRMRTLQVACDNSIVTMTTMTAMLLTITVTFIIATTPISIYMIKQQTIIEENSLEALGNFELYLIKQKTQELWYTIWNFLQYSRSATNFLLYCLSGRRFRTELKSLFSTVYERIRYPARFRSKRLYARPHPISTGTPQIARNPELQFIMAELKNAEGNHSYWNQVREQRAKIVQLHKSSSGANQLAAKQFQFDCQTPSDPLLSSRDTESGLRFSPYQKANTGVSRNASFNHLGSKASLYNGSRNSREVSSCSAKSSDSRQYRGDARDYIAHAKHAALPLKIILPRRRNEIESLSPPRGTSDLASTPQLTTRRDTSPLSASTPRETSTPLRESDEAATPRSDKLRSDSARSDKTSSPRATTTSRTRTLSDKLSDRVTKATQTRSKTKLKPAPESIEGSSKPTLETRCTEHAECFL